MNEVAVEARTSPPPAAPRRSLRRKLLGIVMAATVSALLASAGALLVYEVRAYRQDIADDLASQADLLAQSVAPTLAFDDPRAAGEALASLRLRQQVRAAAVYDADGALFARYPADGSVAVPAQPGLAGVVFTEDGQVQLQRPVLQRGERLGTVHLQARHDTLARVVDYLWILALTTVAGLGLAALIFRQLHPAVTRPILAVAAASRRVIEDRHYAVRVRETSDDEVGTLVEAFNNMLQDLSLEMKERAAAEDALRTADRRKDEFLATLAHELRNPLAPLANGLALLERADADPAMRRRARLMMQRQLAHMVRLVDDLLEVSRITRGQLALRREVTDLVGLARAALEASEPALQQKSQTWELRLPEGPVWVDADAARLTQVLVNLLLNAGKYTQAGGHVRLSLRETAGQAVVEVSDNGMGIAPADQRRIFDMFVQLDGTPERGSSGLGLGLTIARQLVALHGGELGVASDGPGRGSSFSVRLATVPGPRAARAEAPDPGEPASAPASGGGLQVLIADDNVDFAASLAGLLTLEGHAVRVFHDGHSALRAALERPPDVAFLDIGMPGLNGYELAVRLRAAEGTRGLRLVAVTGWGQEADRGRVRQAGYDEHWIKPIDVAQALHWVAGLQAARRAGRAELATPQSPA